MYGTPAKLGDGDIGVFDYFTKYHYIECCARIDTDGFDTDEIAKYKAWVKDNKLIKVIGADPPYNRSILMRNDLLEEFMGPLPDSFVYLMCCWGWNAKDAFKNNGAGSVFGWDDIVMPEDAYPSVMNLFRMMAKLSPAKTDLEAFNDPVLVKDSYNDETGRTAKCHVWPGDGSLYFPAWVNVKADPKSVPAGTKTLGVRVSYADPQIGDKVSGEIDGLEGVLDVMLFPVEASFRVEAKDADGNVLGIGTAKMELNVGKNDVLIDFSAVEVAIEYFEWYGPDPASGDDIYSCSGGYVWDPMPGVNHYYIVLNCNGNDPDGKPDDGDTYVKTGLEYADVDKFYYITYPRSKMFMKGPTWGGDVELKDEVYDYIEGRSRGWTITVTPYD